MIPMGLRIFSWTAHMWDRMKAKHKTKTDKIIGPHEAFRPKLYNFITMKRKSELWRRMWNQKIIHLKKSPIKIVYDFDYICTIITNSY